MNQIKGCIVCAAPGFKEFGGMASYIHNVVKCFSNNGWEIHCIASNDKSDNHKIKNYAKAFHDLSQKPLSLNKIFLVADIINNINPDIVLLNHCALAQYALPLLNISIRPVSVIHSDDSRFYQVTSIFEDRIFRWIAPTISVAQNTLLYISDKNKKRISVIPHGVDNDIFNAKRVTPEINYNIAFVGFVAPNKGTDLLFPIMRRVLLKHPTAHLHIIGYGPLGDEIKNHFVQQGFGNNLTITGRVPPQKVAEILTKADIFLLPTRIEGFGLSIVEAMMCGAVPVVSRLAGITDTIVTDNETGILVEVDNVEGFSSAIVNLLLNPARMNLMRQAAQKTAQEKFTLQRMISDYQQLFAEKDDWTAPPQRGKVGWILETLHEMTRKNPDGTFRFEKKYQTVKDILTS
ncbi:MAG: hypothetical protein CVU62_05745 [Deltaproteobacteria bacterium HGW-Deltaproteobacteria-2]|jgi:glycosyltransferase involved in cell wall biosynthesis|nr:MAG: hypothetical protein CVU62_05745 [Deltaproteobacteria bacterium HGW-Deltaproteobacteria-2]